MSSVAVVGVGQWGVNHVRIFTELGANVTIFDPRKEVLSKISKKFNTKTKDSFEALLSDASIQAVSVCTPASTHHKLVKAALLAGKDVLVEKPLATTVEDAEELVKIANEEGRILQVGHVFRYNNGITKLKSLVESGELGKISLLYSARMGLRTPRTDCGVIFDFAVHDFDLASFILGELPIKITATGKPVITDNEDLAFVTLEFPSGALCHVIVSWLTPNKIREVWLIGEKKSAIFDDVAQDFSIYDKGIIPEYDSYGNFKFLTREGDMVKPRLPKSEPLSDELRSFLDCVKTRKTPLADGKAGLNAVKMVTAALESLRDEKAVELKW